MAQGPRPHPPRRNAWFQFFLGSPRRFLITALVVVFILAALFPQAAQQAIYNALYAILSAVQPFVGQLIMLVIAVGGIYVMLRPLFRKKKKKKGHG